MFRLCQSERVVIVFDEPCRLTVYWKKCPLTHVLCFDKLNRVVAISQ